MDYGAKIAELRGLNQITQEELADRLYVSRDLISKWENNRRRPDRQSLQKLAELFHVDVRYFEPPDRALMEELSKCIPRDLSIRPEEIPSRLNAFLKSISERDASIFVRRYYFCESTSEISEKCCMGDVYIRVVLSRTRKKLKQYFEGGETK